MSLNKKTSENGEAELRIKIAFESRYATFVNISLVQLSSQACAVFYGPQGAPDYKVHCQ